MELILKIRKNKKNGQFNISLPKKKVKIKNNIKFMVIKDFKFMEE